MKKFNVAVMALLSVLLMSCAGKSKDNVLVVSVEPQRALLEEIVGDRFEVVTVLTPGANPETFEPTMQTRKQLEHARAYFVTGHLPFEHKLEEVVPEKVKTVDVSAGITPVYGTHGHDHGDHHHDHGDGADPHVWTSVRNARVMARNMYNTVVDLDPDGKDFYTQRYRALDVRLDSLDRALASRLAASSSSKAFAIWHPSLSYMARDYGLEQISVGFENKEMPALSLRKVIEEAREDGVQVFFFQKEFDSRQAETLNAEIGTRLVTINPMSYDWEQELERIVSELCR